MLSSQGKTIGQGEFQEVIGLKPYMELLSSATDASESTNDPESKIEFSINLGRESEHREWHVLIDASGLKPELGPVELRLTSWGEWNREPDKFIDQLTSNVKIESVDGDATRYRVMPDDDWDGSIQVSYRVKVMSSDSEDRKEYGLMPWSSDTYAQGFTSNTVMDIYQDDKPLSAPRQISFTAKPGDTIVSGWASPSKGTHRTTLDHPIDNTIVVYGSPVETSIGTTNGTDLEVVQFGKGKAFASRLGKDIAKLATSIEASTGLRLRKPIRVFLNDTGGGGTNVDGAMIVGYPPVDENYNDTLMVTAHEFYHEWLGGGFVPVANPESVWFQEGFTDYLSLWHLAHLELISADQFLDRLFLLHDLANESSAVGKIAFGDNNVQWRDGDGANETMAYRGGALLAFYTDLEMRQQGKSGLSRMISDLESRKKTINNQEIKHWYYENDLKDFHRQWIEQPNFLDITVALQRTGYFVDWIPISAAYAGFNTKDNEMFGTVVTLDPNGNAKNAGLQIGDRIQGFFPARTTKVTLTDAAPEFVYGLDTFEVGETIKLGVFRAGKELKINIETKELTDAALKLQLNPTEIKAFLERH